MSEPKTLTLDEILSAGLAALTRVEPVDVPEWGGRVFVREMTAEQADAYDASLYDEDGKLDRANWRAKLVVHTACDAAGNPLFRPEQVGQVGKLGASAVRRIFRAAAGLNRLREEDAAAGKDDSAAAPAAA